MFISIAQIVKNAISVKFIIHLFIGMIIRSTLIVVFGNIATRSVINGTIQLGLCLFACQKIVEIVNTLHQSTYLKKSQMEFRKSVHREVHKLLTEKYLTVPWDECRKLDTEKFDQKKSTAKWMMVGFATRIINSVIVLLPSIGYSIWLFNRSPLSIFILMIIVLFSIKFIKKPVDTVDKFSKIMRKINIYEKKKFNKTIHNQGGNTINKIIRMVEEQEDMNQKSSNDWSNYSRKIDLSFAVGIILDFYIKSQSDALDSTFVILYVQYMSILSNNMYVFGEMYTSYKQTKIEYDLFMKLFEGKNSYREKEQMNMIEKLTIDDLFFEYPNNNNKARFSLETTGSITLNRGHVCLLKGDISNGKSTFMDIVSGVIPSSKCSKTSIYIDNILQNDGFEVLTKSRLYCEQESDIDWKPSIFEIVSDEDPNNYAIHNKLTENNVWWSLEKACCADYFTLDKKDKGKKWIYTEDIEPSPGLKACIRMAQIFFQLKTGKFTMVVGDELDASIKASRAVKAMNNLFSYCRKNLILLIVSAHTTEVQNLKYDKILNFNIGRISIEDTS